MKKQMTLQGDCGFTNQQENMLAMWKAKVDTQTALLQAATSSNRQLGTVLMSSGLDEMTENGYILDWSLIKLSPSRFVHPELLNNVSLLH